MNPDLEYLIFLGKSYGRPLNRAEWDSLYPSENSSKEILKKFNIKDWHEFWELCEFPVAPYTKEDMIRYGKAIGMENMEIKREQWDYFLQLPNLQNERIPDSRTIIIEFGSWTRFQQAIKIKPSHRNREKKKLLEIEELFLKGLIPINIARKTGWPKNKIEEYLSEVGLFSPEYIREHFPSLEEITGRQIRNIKFYNGEEKKILREFMISETAKILKNSKQICYCGLPGPNFIDYALIAENFEIIPEKSLAAEYDKVSGYIMHSFIKNWNQIRGGEIFRRLKLYPGRIENALKEPRYADMQFNLINHDCIGGWGKDKCAAINNLFMHKHLADEALIFITLNNSAFEQKRAECSRGYKLLYTPGDKHIDIAKRCIEHLAKKNKMEATEIYRMPYRDTIEMITGAYFIKRKRK